MNGISLSIQEHLDAAATHEGYLDAINGTTPESLVDAQMKMYPLQAALGGNPTTGGLLSVGVGQGEELHALRLVFGADVPISGIDLSKEALHRASERSANFKLDIKRIFPVRVMCPDTPQSLCMVSCNHKIWS